MDFTAPHFVLFESTEDPFGGVVERLFRHADYPFERVDVEPSDEGGVDRDLPLGRLPALRVDGVTLAGFPTVCRAIATRVGLDGRSLKESNEADMIVDFIDEQKERLRPVMRTGVPVAEVDERIEDFLQNLAPFLNARLKASGANRIVGEEITWADFVLVHFLRVLTEFAGTSLLQDFPHLSLYFHNNKNL